MSNRAFATLRDFVERAISLINPAAALRYRHQHNLLERAYTAAKTTGPNQTWRAPRSSAYGEIHAGWNRVTARARDLTRNNAYVAGMVRRFVLNVVGGGMWPKSKVITAKGQIDAALAAEIESRWNRWAERACANGDSMADAQRLVANHFLVDGESIALRRSVAGQPLALEILEADQLDSSRDKNAAGERTVGGIKFNAAGSPVGYWLMPCHPADVMTEARLIPAEDVLHVFDRQRASQVRGICAFASIIGEIFDTCEYQDATLILARVATAFGVFIQSPTPDDFSQTNTLGLASDNITRQQYVNPGGVHQLLPGETIGQVKPENPGGNYDPFVRSRLRGASAGSGISYESFSNDYSQASYSSARQAMIAERAFYRFCSELIDNKFNIPVYRWWLDREVRLNGLRLPGYDRDPRPFQAVKFSKPKSEWIDPAKEASAAKDRLSIGLETLTELAENEGRDIDEVFATRAAEVARMKELGIFQIDAAGETFTQVQQDEPPQEQANDNQV